MKTVIAVIGLALMPFGIFGCGPEKAVDNIDLPFINDPEVIGDWVSVDFVVEPSLFKPRKKNSADDFYLEGLTFLPAGKMPQNYWTWTKGVVMHSGDKTASAYTIKEIAGHTYMFFEWKSIDYIIHHMKPKYYVLVKK